MSTLKDHIAVISGGSAANSLVDVFNTLIRNRPDAKLSYIIGISDNGGVFGGPGIGDIRSRLVRLAPNESRDVEKEAVKRLLNHRLPESNEEARSEWNSLVEGRHVLWHDIPSEKKELIRSFFIFLSAELIKRARPSSSFNFQLASLGNLFLTGSRLFFGSLESAIYLTRSIIHVPENVHVIPALNSNFSHHIAAGLANGVVIAGQNQISHPTDEGPVPEHANKGLLQPPTPSPGPTRIPTPVPQLKQPIVDDQDLDEIEDANLPGSLSTLRKNHIVFTKEHEADLATRIDRIWYINPYGQEMKIRANQKILASIKEAESLVYSIGSLYTSIIPCLILRGVGEIIANSCRQKILILNGSYDREIGPGTDFTAADFVKAIARACVQSREPLSPVDQETLLDPSEYKRYVTHVLYLEGPDVPVVDVTELKDFGIECWRVYGRRNKGGKGMLYDAQALTQALEMIIGKRMPQSRRQTVDATAGNAFLSV